MTTAAVRGPSTVWANPNGTLTEMDRSAAGELPQQFTKDGVEGYYFSRRPEASPGPELSAAGMRLFEAVRARFLDVVPRCPYGSPSLTFTGGLPGSGKGRILRDLAKGSPQFVHVDPDEIKNEILKNLADANPALRNDMATEKGWNNIIHETASFLAKRLMSEALESGKDIVFDSSMASSNLEKHRKFAQVARARGYKVNGLICSVTVDVARERARRRADEPTRVSLGDATTLQLSGRVFNDDYLVECSRQLPQNLATYLDEGLFDRCVVFDNNSKDDPARVEAVYVRCPTGPDSFTCLRGQGT